jgi:hypothetical protein
LNGFISSAIQWQIKKSRKITDKIVSKALPKEEKLQWSGRPGFVATFNSREFVFSILITVIISVIVLIIFGESEFGYEFNALLSVTVCVIALLFIGWVRQVYRYIATLGMYYAVTASRLVIIKNGKIIKEMKLELIKSTSISKKLFGNGSVVFNEGEDYLKHNLIEAPSKKVFAFFNVLDPYNVLKTLT